MKQEVILLKKFVSSDKRQTLAAKKAGMKVKFVE
jgi:hypothetical protein